MILEVMREVRNTFWDGFQIVGEFSAKSGIIELSDEFQAGGWIYVNNKREEMVYKLHKFEGQGNNYSFYIGDSVNEVFNCVKRLRIPHDFLRLVQQIEEYSKSGLGNSIVSEQFGEYRYTVEKSWVSWEEKFAKPLMRYRKMFDKLLC